MKCSGKKNSSILSFKIIVLLLLFLNTHILSGQSLQPYQPTKQQQMQAYKYAAQMDSLAKNSIFKFSVKAHWQIEGTTFWYQNHLVNNKLVLS